MHALRATVARARQIRDGDARCASACLSRQRWNHRVIATRDPGKGSSPPVSAYCGQSRQPPCRRTISNAVDSLSPSRAAGAQASTTTAAASLAARQHVVAEERQRRRCRRSSAGQCLRIGPRRKPDAGAAKSRTRGCVSGAPSARNHRRRSAMPSAGRRQRTLSSGPAISTMPGPFGAGGRRSTCGHLLAKPVQAEAAQRQSPFAARDRSRRSRAHADQIGKCSQQGNREHVSSSLSVKASRDQPSQHQPGAAARSTERTMASTKGISSSRRPGSGGARRYAGSGGRQPKISGFHRTRGSPLVQVRPIRSIQ